MLAGNRVFDRVDRGNVDFLDCDFLRKSRFRLISSDGCDFETGIEESLDDLGTESA